MLEIITRPNKLMWQCLNIPIEDLCPKTHEPIKGSYIMFTYKSADKSIGLQAVQHYIETLKNKPMDLETLCAMLYNELVGIFPNIHLKAHFVLSHGTILDLEIR